MRESHPMTNSTTLNLLKKDLSAGLVVFLVALPLCLGIAHASGAPLISGLISGIVGGIVVGLISRSQTSVSGPAAGLVAVVISQINALQSFEAFLCVVILAGVFQLILGLLKVGKLTMFCPNNVIKGLLAAIGVIIIVRQLPFLVGYTTKDDIADSSSFNTGEGPIHLVAWLSDFSYLHIGAAIIGLLSFALLLYFDKKKTKLPIPAPVLVVGIGITISYLFSALGLQEFTLHAFYLVQVPVADSLATFLSALPTPNFEGIFTVQVITYAATLAVVASLETLLNLEAVDRIDPKKRLSSPDRELIAQGAGNICSGFLGGIPVTSVIVRSSVNINSGAETKLSTIFHGVLLLVAIVAIPSLLNLIPMASLAAILLATGLKLASPTLIKSMWKSDYAQSVPFFTTLIAIVATDLLVGLLIGIAVATIFVLKSHFHRPFRVVDELHVGGHITRIILPSHANFLTKGPLMEIFASYESGAHVVVDARESDYIDPDVEEVIREFAHEHAPKVGVVVSLMGFKDRYALNDKIEFVDVSTKDVQSAITPQKVLRLLQEGNARFVRGEQLYRDRTRAIDATSQGQFPLAAVLSCIDSRTSTELVFDQGLGDIFGIRMAGATAGDNVIGSLEFAVNIAGSKLIVVLGHTKCGAVKAACEMINNNKNVHHETGCEHLHIIVDQIAPAITATNHASDYNRESTTYFDLVARQNVVTAIETIMERSSVIRSLRAQGKVAIVGAMYDVKTGKVEFLEETLTADLLTSSDANKVTGSAEEIAA